MLSLAIAIVMMFPLLTVGLRSTQDCSYGVSFCRQMYESYGDPLDTAGAEALASKGTYCKPWQYVGNELGSVCYGLAWTDGLESSICYHSGTTQTCRGLPVSCSCTPPTTEEETPAPTTSTSPTPTAPVTTVIPSTTIPLRI